MSDVTAAVPPTLDRLRGQVAEILEVDPAELADDANLLLLGLDSLGMMRLVNQWRREGVRVSSRALLADPTVAAWHKLLLDLRAHAVAEAPAPGD